MAIQQLLKFHHLKKNKMIWPWLFKGQLISLLTYAVLNFPKMHRNIANISALASKMGQIKKVNARYHPN